MSRDEVIINNQNLIYYVIKKMNLYDKQEEFFDIGMIGLIKGADTYDSQKGTMSSYLYRCIYNQILLTFRKKRIATVSLEEPTSDNLTLEDLITDDYDFTCEIEKKEQYEKLYSFLNELSEREKNMLVKYFGLFNTQKYTQIEIAKLYNISQGYVNRIIQRAIRKLQYKFRHEK